MNNRNVLFADIGGQRIRNRHNFLNDSFNFKKNLLLLEVVSVILMVLRLYLYLFL